MAQQNQNPMKMQYKTREEVEQFLFQSPQAFREALEQNPEMRQNFQVLLQTWNPADIMAVSWFMQTDPATNPINGQKVLLENVAKDFSQWANQEADLLKANRYHSLSSFEQFHKEREEMRLIAQRREMNMDNRDDDRREREEREKKQQQQQAVQEQLNNLLRSSVENIKDFLNQEYENIQMSDARWRRMLIRLVPTKLYPGYNEEELAGVGMLMMGKPEEVLKRIIALAEQDDNFRQALARHNVEMSDIKIENTAEVFGAVSKIMVNEEVPGYSPETLKTVLDEKSQRVLETAQTISRATDISHTERQQLQAELFENSSAMENYRENIQAIKEYDQRALDLGDINVDAKSTNIAPVYNIENQKKIYKTIVGARRKEWEWSSQGNYGPVDDFYFDFIKKGYISEDGLIQNPRAVYDKLKSYEKEAKKHLSSEDYEAYQSYMKQVRVMFAPEPTVPERHRPQSELAGDPPSRKVKDPSPDDEARQRAPKKAEPKPTVSHDNDDHKPKAVKPGSNPMAAEKVQKAPDSDFG